ncbi:MAG: SIMPL domain-containing protein [Polyangiaceae bacterium]|nr:SIMPL domain-containing protein [Polyangiaceae bacterium]
MAKREVVKGTLELTGTGVVDVAPDMATLRLSVVTERKTAAQAVADNAAQATELTKRLLEAGVAKNDLQTEGLNLYPVYQTDPQTGASSLVGYRVSNTISANCPIALAGKVFDVAAEAGADEGGGLSFGLRDPKPHREKALQLAVAAAQKEAELVAKAMDLSLNGPKTVIVQSGSGPIRVESLRLVAKAATPVSPGSLSITASVQVIFETST